MTLLGSSQKHLTYVGRFLPVIPTMLNYQVLSSFVLQACIYHFMMKHEPAILVSFIKDRPLEDMTVPPVYKELLKLSQIAMVRSEAFISRPLRGIAPRISHVSQSKILTTAL